MKSIALIAAQLIACAPLLAAPAPDTAWWPQFRGPSARGVAEGAPLPAAWDGTAKRNVVWKTPIPGLGHSSPAIWGDRLFVTTAISAEDKAGIRTGLYGNIDPVEDDSKHRYVVYCIDRNTGEVLWTRTARESVPTIKRHTKSTHANPTPAVDDKRVVVSFGSEGLYAYDHAGALLWKNDLGRLDSGYFAVPEAQWGFASSPVLHAGRVIVQADVQQDSFLAAFDAATGETIWRVSREEVPTWSTPTVFDSEGTGIVLVNGYKHIGGYAFADGKELWRMAGTGDIPIPTPYVADGVAYFTSAHGPGSPIYAIAVDARGTLLPDPEKKVEHVLWSLRGGGSYMPTTVAYRGLLYVCRDNGVLSVYDAKTGARHYQHRLGSGQSGFVASAVAGDGKVYFTDEEGVTHVVSAGTEFELLASNDLGEVVLASPAIADGTLYFRTRDHVVAVRTTEPATGAKVKSGG